MNAGLLVIPGRMDLVLGRTGAYAVPDPHAKMHESLTGLWWLAEILWKRHYNWGPAKVGAAAQPRPATHHPAKLADPRIGLPAWRRLRQASAPRCDPN